MTNNNRERIVQVIFHIPPGRVTTYGEVAERAGLPRAARLVGTTLRTLPDDSRLPWHRVVNSQGCISIIGASADEQRQRLLAEGVNIRGKRIAPQHRLADRLS